ncbi:MAG: hypothetical protein QM767_24555 [Anaeromyxobacter sp.]
MLTIRHLGALRSAIATVAFLLTAGCSQAPRGVVDTSGDELGQALDHFAGGQAGLEGANGISQNGISQNGISQNGISQNGISPATLGSADFVSWFDSSPQLAEVFLRYTYRCAAPAGATLTWTHPVSGVTYAWPGGLGLAPAWAAGAAPTVAEKQAVSACLAALSNRYGVSVTIAVEGRTAGGEEIEVSADELRTFSQREGCFFGNVFDGQGYFVGLDHPGRDAAVSSPRACALHDQAAGVSVACPPLVHVGHCATVCTPSASGISYDTCTWGGVAYHALSTRVKGSDIYRCGDGVCQFTEHCGTGTTADACQSDCGVCPTGEEQ